MNQATFGLRIRIITVTKTKRLFHKSRGMLGIYIENSFGEPLAGLDHVVNSVQSQPCRYAMCALCLYWIRQETVRVPSLSNEHLALHSDASA